MQARRGRRRPRADSGRRGTTWATSTSSPAGCPGRSPRWRRPRTRWAATCTRSAGWTAPGCCARPAWSATPTCCSPGSRRSCGPRGSGPGPRRDRAGAGRVRARRAASADLARRARPRRRRAAVRAARQPVAGSAGPSCSLLRCERRSADGRRARARRPALPADRRPAPPQLAVRLPGGAAPRPGPDRRPARPGVPAAGRRAAGRASPRRGCAPATRCQSRLHVREVRTAASRCTAGTPPGPPRRYAAGWSSSGSYQSGFGLPRPADRQRGARAAAGPARSRRGAAQRQPGGFFAALERARAVSTRLPQVAPPSDERTAALLTELRRSEEEARDLAGRPRRRGVARPGCAPGSPACSARSAPGPGSWRARTGAPAARSARVAEVRQRARELGTAFVSYVVHDGRWRAVLACRRPPPAARPGRRGRGRGAGAAGARRPGRAGDAAAAGSAAGRRTALRSRSGCAGSTTCSWRRWVSTGRRWWSRPARRWR